ncbi:hypothetical protein FGK63_19655 [Ruegeria sediminis]|uniref:DUF1127 domain-containing protein n=1 Tax=Ruegeria sediminis TaxID=2583820 RepID=A0ABY2WTF5_9RHOB|nr:hypothetical protein [Ruegeria sediminis]TMV03391.1 hypothetical protein FGK63_19655 [Ruegeria sediminis]
MTGARFDFARLWALRPGRTGRVLHSKTRGPGKGPGRVPRGEPRDLDPHLMRDIGLDPRPANPPRLSVHYW